jgi:hypothetical protein
MTLEEDGTAFRRALFRWLADQEVTPQIALPAMLHIVAITIAEGPSTWPEVADGLFRANQVLNDTATAAWNDRDDLKRSDIQQPGHRQTPAGRTRQGSRAFRATAPPVGRNKTSPR